MRPDSSRHFSLAIRYRGIISAKETYLEDLTYNVTRTRSAARYAGRFVANFFMHAA